ncbi:hypothetical protein B0H12DRAFT_369906 [Mycena haematopus]|nr:hypothetical protein B0H12DRAFT_369906 [Mycena haematopus]
MDGGHLPRSRSRRNAQSSVWTQMQQCAPRSFRLFWNVACEPEWKTDIRRQPHARPSSPFASSAPSLLARRHEQPPVTGHPLTPRAAARLIAQGPTSATGSAPHLARRILAPRVGHRRPPRVCALSLCSASTARTRVGWTALSSTRSPLKEWRVDC